MNWPTSCQPLAHGAKVLATCWAFSLLTTSQAWGTIYGSMSNFDVYNESTTNAYGAELELEGVHLEDVYSTFPAHFNHEDVTEYVNGTQFGVRIKYTGYNFDSSGYLKPTQGESTNGHACVNLAGCEHFGFALGANQPTATRYYWLDQQGARIGNMPLSIPTPSWSYQPAQGGGDPMIEAEVELPRPEHEVQNPDAVWMKIYETEIDRPVGLHELMSDDPIVPDDEREIEIEWELLDGGKNHVADGKLGKGKQAVVRRYEFFAYTGLYDDEHEAISDFELLNLREPPAHELGQFIAANMVAANLVPIAIPSDFNADGAVDAADAGILFENWGENSGNRPATDLNRDRYTDAADAGIVFANWSGDSRPVAAIPEPMSTTCLFGLGTLGLSLCRRSARRASTLN